MNILLWVLQIALAFLCISGGLYKITHFEQLQGMMVSLRALPKVLWMFFGGFEALAGLGLVLPALSSYAAAAILVESVVITAIYISYGDHAPVPYTAIGAVLAAFIAYGRFVLKPF
jgi:uncharacterized membrane protein YphA (DoxX/SURF4 family)